MSMTNVSFTIDWGRLYADLAASLPIGKYMELMGPSGAIPASTGQGTATKHD